MLTSQFGVRTNENSTLIVRMSEVMKDNVYYGTNIDGKYQSYQIPWNDRYNENVIKAVCGTKDATLSFGKKFGLFKEKTKNGEERNVVKTLTTYDTIKEMKKLKDNGTIFDGISVSVNGRVLVNTQSKKENGESINRKYITLEPNDIYSHKNIDFSQMDENEIKRNSIFDMEIIIKEFNEYNNETILTAYVVGSDFIEEMEFGFTVPKLVKAFKSLAPYTMIRVHGTIVQQIQEETIVVEDDPFDDGSGSYVVNKGFSKMLFLIGKGDPETIDSETYTEENIEKAKQALRAYKNDYNAGASVENLEFGDDDYENIGEFE